MHFGIENFYYEEFGLIFFYYGNLGMHFGIKKFLLWEFGDAFWDEILKKRLRFESDKKYLIFKSTNKCLFHVYK